MTPNRTLTLGARIALLAVMCASLGACAAVDAVGGIFGGGDDDRDPNAPDESRRVPVLTREQALTVTEGAAEVVDLPLAYVNDAWPQTGSTATHAMQHPEIGGFSRAWRRSIGQGDGRNGRIRAQPVVEGGRVFAVDARGLVSAYDAERGNQIWRRELRVENERDTFGLGGGVAVGSGSGSAS